MKPFGFKINTPVAIVGTDHDGLTGRVVAGTAWYRSERDPGDRVVRLDVTGERLVFEHRCMRSRWEVILRGGLGQG